MNLTETVEFHTEFNVILHSIEIIMILLIWVLVQIPGNFMLYLLIQFDRLGGDPMKRRLVDQVRINTFTSNCCQYYAIM